MILYFFGDDNFRSKQHLKNSVDQFKKQRDPSGYNTSFFDGKKTTAEKLLAEVNAMPFLSEKRLVVVENFLSSSDKESVSLIIEKIINKKIPENTVLIFWQGDALGKIKEAKELHALLQKEKFAQEFSHLDPVKLSSWIEKEVVQKGGTIDKRALAELSQNFKDDMWSLSNVISQLVAYKNKGQIVLEDVQNFVDEKIDDNIFNLVDAVISGNHKRAFRLLSNQRELGEEDGKIFGLILWQFRIIIQISDLLERESALTSEEIASRLKIHPFVAKKNLPIARNYSLAKLEKIYNQMLEIDKKIKTGQADQSVLIDLLVAKI